MSFLKLPTLANLQQTRRPCGKGPSRLDVKVKALPVARMTEGAFRAAVKQRDKYRCRRCGCKVLSTLAAVPTRAEVHHLHGRRGALRCEVRTALTLCAVCHEKVTRHVIVPVASTWWTFHDKAGPRELIDATGKVDWR